MTKKELLEIIDEMCNKSSKYNYSRMDWIKFRQQIQSQDKTDRRGAVSGQRGLRQNLVVYPDTQKGCALYYSELRKQIQEEKKQ